MPEKYLTQTDAEKRLEELSVYLTPQQVNFLLARRKDKTDKLAAATSGVAYTTLGKWKSTNKFFIEAYDLTKFIRRTLPKLPDAASTVATRDKLYKEVDKLVATLPAVVAEHIRLALHGESERTQLEAIKMIYEAVNFKPESSMPISKQNSIFVNILKLTAPQIQAEAAKRGIPIDAPVETIVEGVWENIPKEVLSEGGEEEVENV